jgi:hypothetical protein
MTDPRPVPAELDAELLCYCVKLTLGALRAACGAGAWPLPDKQNAGNLCTACRGDLLYCLRVFGGPR